MNGTSSEARLGDPGAGAGVAAAGVARVSLNPAVSKESAVFSEPRSSRRAEASPRIHTAPFPEDLARTASANLGE